MKFYFTIGNGLPNENCVQPIIADDWDTARDAMFEKYGDKWSFQYTEKDWNDWKNKVKNSKVSCPLETELPTINIIQKVN